MVHWDVREQAAQRRYFSVPTICKKFKRIQLYQFEYLNYLRVSPPLNLHSQNAKVLPVGLYHFPKFCCKKAKATTDMTLRATNKIQRRKPMGKLHTKNLFRNQSLLFSYKQGNYACRLKDLQVFYPTCTLTSNQTGT